MKLLVTTFFSRLSLFALLLLFCAPVACAADWKTKPQSAIHTVRGDVYIEWSDDGARVMYRGNILLQSPDSGAFDLGPVFPDAKSAKLVLVSIQESGEACPELYRVIEFSKNKLPVLSPEFGNCNVLADPTWWEGPSPSRGNPYFENGKWFIGIPAIGDSLVLEWWEYNDGKVRRAP